MDDRSASFLTSSATTAKPRPCSPALAASIAAFRARRLVWAAISSMVATILPISSDRLPRSATLKETRSMAFFILSIPSTVSWVIRAPVSAELAVLFQASAPAWAFFDTSVIAADTWVTMPPASSTPLACSWAPLAIWSIALDSCSTP